MSVSQLSTSGRAQLYIVALVLGVLLMAVWLLTHPPAVAPLATGAL